MLGQNVSEGSVNAEMESAGSAVSDDRDVPGVLQLGPVLRGDRLRRGRDGDRRRAPAAAGASQREAAA